MQAAVLDPVRTEPAVSFPLDLPSISDVLYPDFGSAMSPVPLRSYRHSRHRSPGLHRRLTGQGRLVRLSRPRRRSPHRPPGRARLRAPRSHRRLAHEGLGRRQRFHRLLVRCSSPLRRVRGLHAAPLSQPRPTFRRRPASQAPRPARHRRQGRCPLLLRASHPEAVIIKKDLSRSALKTLIVSQGEAVPGCYFSLGPDELYIRANA